MPVDQIIESAQLRPPFTEANRKFFQTQDRMWHLFGEPGTSVALTFSTGTGPETHVSLERMPRPAGRRLFPEAPPVYLSMRVSVMPGGAHYVGFNAFQPGIADEVIAAIDTVDPLTPLILDLRGDNGGSAFSAEELLGHLYRQPTHAYDRVTRSERFTTQVGGTPNAHAG